MNVRFEEDQWIVISDGAKSKSTLATKKEAIEKGKEIAQNKETTLTIYKKDDSKEKKSAILLKRINTNQHTLIFYYRGWENSTPSVGYH